jgi:predicted outer membrane protein
MHPRKLFWLGFAAFALLPACGGDDDSTGGAGAAGTSGTAGTSGSTGTSGTSGTSGTTGTSGTSGTTGTSGGASGANGTGQNNGGSSAVGSSGGGAPTATNPRTTDGTVLDFAIVANNGEVEMGQDAVTKVQNAAVRDFAQMMIDDHSAALSMAMALADSSGIQTESSGLSDMLQSQTHMNIETVDQASAADVDATFMNIQVMVHQQVLGVLQGTLLPPPVNPDLQTFMQSMQTVVQMHLAEAQSIVKTL